MCLLAYIRYACLYISDTFEQENHWGWRQGWYFNLATPKSYAKFYFPTLTTKGIRWLNIANVQKYVATQSNQLQNKNLLITYIYTSIAEMTSNYT